MGGFGAFQLGGWAPDAFDVVISVAGYGLGTLEPESGSAPGKRLNKHEKYGKTIEKTYIYPLEVM